MRNSCKDQQQERVKNPVSAWKFQNVYFWVFIHELIVSVSYRV